MHHHFKIFGIFEGLLPTSEAYLNFVRMVLAGKRHQDITHITLEDV